MAVQGGGKEDVYATVHTYLPGALVLAHSLRDAGTTKKLVALVTLDSVSAEAITELKSVYDYVIPVPRIRNDRPANLQLMNRTDLHSAFTKINLWNQCQFRKIVYIDADVVAYRAPDELFNITHPFSAAPDIGWPDLFNTGVMVLTPNMGDYYAMMAMAERGISFDGADQGLINTHFRNNYNRISFAYNVTPSAHYQYIPAYRHFQSSINMVHFIGSDKPWFQGRHASIGSSPFDEMTGRWWAVYDRHYRVASEPSSFVSSDAISSVSNYEDTEAETSQEQIGAQGLSAPPPEPEQDPPLFQPPMSSWDAQKHPPPVESKPEAINFPATIYEMSKNTAPFIAPQQYPSPPKDMWYEVPKEAPAAPSEPLKPIFPWEANRPKPSRIFVEEKPIVSPQPEPHDVDAFSNESQPQRDAKPLVDPSAIEASTEEQASQPVTPITPTIQITPSDPWASYTLTNAWDDVPEIERYVGSMQKHRRSKSLQSPGMIGLPSPSEGIDVTWRRRGSKVTDFPSEVERPSLPVTPAPIHRPNFWGGGPDAGEGNNDLPSAEGVPGQGDWPRQERSVAKAYALEF
ncbi:hypothetical protein ONZ43_g72 [Nemania bipapillata]|uniref:Uncharacterized protein n=1 Tax=Nemania bipapillata TaxID=110536 RepID=A0ACC2JAF8_9PEZI|nr:hypothetical protein ONZ43_g72 [Nemania bipapillata]